jgi:hypothetical protein
MPHAVFALPVKGHVMHNVLYGSYIVSLPDKYGNQFFYKGGFSGITTAHNSYNRRHYLVRILFCKFCPPGFLKL